MEAAIHPTEPQANSWTGKRLGVNTPNSVTSKSLPLFMKRMVSLSLIDPSLTRT